MAIAANTDQKRENLLNLSLSVSEEERMRSESLETGFDREERTWELIVRYSGDLSGLEALGVQTDILLNGYAILIVPEVRSRRSVRCRKLNISRNQRGCSCR